MNRFSRISHHVSVKEVKQKRLEKLAEKKLEEKKIDEEKNFLISAMNHARYDWRQKNDRNYIMREGMTTGNMTTTTVPAAEGDGEVSSLNAIDGSSYTAIDSFFAKDDNLSANLGTQIRASGAGTGQDSGFNVSGNYLAFQGTGTADSANTRFAVLSPIDSTKIDTLQIRAIVGNDSNGGEDPDENGEQLMVMYKTPAMVQPKFIIQRPDGSIPSGITGTEDQIIPIGAAPNAGLNDYSISIPDYARAEGTQFILIQPSNSGVGFDNYGVTEIKFLRKAPVTVFVPLDDPEAISFVSVGTNEGDPKKRKKKVNDQLAASDEYTSTLLGDRFPGQGGRISEEDPFKSTDIQDVTEPSPIGKDEVTRSFSNFSAKAAAAEPEPIPPSTQTTMAPTNDDGEEISVKEVGGKNSGVVQGADAANLDAQEPEPTEPEPTEPDPTESEPEVDPEEIKPDPEELKGKTPDEQKQLEIDKKQTVLNSELTKIQNQLNNIYPDREGFLNYLSILAGGVQTVLRLAGAISNLTSMITGKSKPKWMVEKDIAFAKLADSIAIARSQLTGRIIGYDPNPSQINEFIEGAVFAQFIDTPNNPAGIPVSSVRHEYADENIYVKDGKVYNNRDEKATDLTKFAYRGFVNQGQGYAQMIIPPDGSEPYIHYYDYSYNNLNNPEDIGGEFKSVYSSLSDFSLYLSSVPAFGGFLGKMSNPQRFMDGLKKTSSLEGWPAGIHGASLTDFKIPLSKLLPETQEYIARHPLMWTDERVANMSDDYLYEQFDIILQKGKIYDPNNFDEELFNKKINKILNDRKSNIDPEYAKAFTDYIVQYDKYKEKNKELQDIYKKPEAGLAREKSKEDWRALQEEQREATKKEELHKKFSKGIKIPNPETDGDKYPDYDEWVKGDKKEYDELIAQQDKFAKDAMIYYKTTTKPAFDKALDYENSLEKRGDGYVRGTKEQIAKYRKLVAEYEKASKEHDRLFALQDEPMNKASELLGAFQDEYNRKLAVWKPYNKELDRVYREVNDMYQELVDEAYTKYQMTFAEKNKDGVYEYVNGGDYTDPSGKTYDGIGTLTSAVQEEIDEIELLMKEYDQIFDKYGDRYFPEKVSQYLVNKNNIFGYVDWSPEKKGSGTERPDRSQSNNQGGSPSNYGYGYAGVDPNDASFLGYSIEDKKNVINFYKKKKNNPNYQPKPYELESIMRQQQAQQFGGGNIQVAHFKPKGKALFERVKPKPFFNPKDIKPTFPEKPPGKIDPKTGMHSEYGKRARRFKKLDPMSANAMPVQGDPELDAVVNQQRTKEIPSKRREKYIKKVAEQKKYSWRQDFIKESEWSPVTGAGPTNATSQTFGYFDGGGNPIVNSQTGQQVTTTASGLGGVEATSSTTTIDLGFGETLNVSSPTYDQLALAGIAKPIVMKRKETDDTNKKLDASQKFAKKVGADVMMNARVKTGELSLEQKKEFVEIYKKSMEEYDKKSAERSREIEKRINANISKVNKFLSKYGQKLQSSYPMGNSDIRIINGGRKLVVISHSGFNYSDTEKFNVRVFEAMPGKTISKKTGNFGKVSGKGFLSNVYSKGSGSGQATIMYTNIGSQIEGKNFNIIGVPNVTMPTPPKFMQKNMSKGWQPSATSSYDKEFINKMNAWFNTIPTGGANFPAQLAINLAKGNLDPVTKSPGPVITNLIKQNILDNLKQGFTKSDKLGTISYWDSKSGKGAIRYDMYKGFTAKMAPVSAALGRYSIERTDKGIRIADTYDISGGFTSPGGAAIFDPLTKLIGGKDVQLTGETLTAIAARRAAELGYDMVDADTGKTLQPVYSGEEEFNSRTYPNSGAPTIATPKGFNIKIDFTIPWSSFPSETVNQLKIGGKQIVNPLSTTKKPSKAVQTIKKMAKTKSIGFDRDEPIVRRKKKKK